MREVKKTPRAPEVQTILLYKKQLLVGRFSRTPGTVVSTLRRAEEEGLTCTWGSGQCMSTEWEADILKGVQDCDGFDEFVRRMKYFKYRVETDEPQLVKRRFTRL